MGPSVGHLDAAGVFPVCRHGSRAARDRIRDGALASRTRVHAATHQDAARGHRTLRARLASTLCVLLLVLSSSLTAIKLSDKPIAPETVDAGGTINVYGSELVAAASADLYDTSGKKVATLDAPTIDTDKSVWTFRLPRNIEPGRYFLKISAGDLQQALAPGDVRVRRPEARLESVSPTTAYRDALGGFSFLLLCQNFSGKPSEDVVENQGQGGIGASPLPAHDAAQSAR